MPAAPVIAAVAAVASTAYSVYSGEKAASAQKEAAKQAEKQAAKQAEQADQEFNKANQKTAYTRKMLAANQQASLSGQSGTMLTGSQGSATSTSDIGKSTLLGQ